MLNIYWVQIIVILFGKRKKNKNAVELEYENK